MKYYKYKQVQRMTFFGFDDTLKGKDTSFIKMSPQTREKVNAGTYFNSNIVTTKDTKILRFDINKLLNIQLSQNARIVIENLSLPILVLKQPGPLDEVVTYRKGPITVRMNNLNTNSFDSQNKGYNNTLIYTSEGQLAEFPFNNSAPEILYNFSIDQNFFKNGYVELQITYPDIHLLTTDLDRFYISFVVYDMNEEDLLLKDTPEVNFKKFGPHNPHNPYS